MFSDQVGSEIDILLALNQCIEHKKLGRTVNKSEQSQSQKINWFKRQAVTLQHYDDF